MLGTQIDMLLDLWLAMLLKYGENGPYEDHMDLYCTIDSTPLGNVAWESFSIKYNGTKPQDDIPDWMMAKYDVWFQDPCTIIQNLISNPDFDGRFDYMPFQEYDRIGNHHLCDFMSGNWAWRQAVSLFIFAITFVLQFYKDIISKKKDTHGSMFVPIILGSNKTTVSVATGHNEYWPIYISIGNIYNNIQRAHRNGLFLLGFLAIPKST